MRNSIAVSINEKGGIWTFVHARPEVGNAMDPESATALFDSFKMFDSDDNSRVAVF